MQRGFLFVSAIADGSCLGVVATRDCDVGSVGYQTTDLVARVGQLLTPGAARGAQAARIVGLSGRTDERSPPHAALTAPVGPALRGIPSRVDGPPRPCSRPRYWHHLDDGRVQCDVCPRACKLRPGQRGVCFVRGRADADEVGGADDGVVLLTYGRSSGYCVDPVEKKPLNHFLPGIVGAVVRHRRAATWPAGSARTGTSPSPRRSTRWPTPPAPRTSPRPPCGSAAAASRSPTTTRRSSSSTPSTSPTPATRSGVQAIAVTRRLHLPRAPRASSTRHLDAAQRRPQGVHRGVLPAQSAAGTSSRCSRRSSTCATRPTCGSRSRPC